jgi:hypothetical protein
MLLEHHKKKELSVYVKELGERPHVLYFSTFHTAHTVTDGEQVPVYSGELYAAFVNNICGHVIGNEMIFYLTVKS